MVLHYSLTRYATTNSAIRVGSIRKPKTMILSDAFCGSPVILTQP
jgi:hypothetical protein